MAVRVKQGKERYALRNVLRQGHRAIVPFVVEEDRPREQPLFPGYIFVQGPEWYYLQSTYGCLYPIMMGGSPAFMPLKEMKDILSMVDKEGTIPLPAEKFRKDQAVTIKRGSFKGFSGLYIRASGKRRVEVLLQLLGGKHVVEFQRSWITGATTNSTGQTHTRPVR